MRSKKISLVIVPLLLTACSHNNDRLVRDVYDNQYDCQNDWNSETCEPDQQRANSTGHSHGATSVLRYLGPQYYANNREVSFRGTTLRPHNAASPPRTVISTVAQPYASSKPIRGGFGRLGFSFGG